MEDSFKLLEEKVHRAAERLKALSSEVKALRREREEIRERIGKLLGLLERL